MVYNGGSSNFDKLDRISSQAPDIFCDFLARVKKKPNKNYSILKHGEIWSKLYHIILCVDEFDVQLGLFQSMPLKWLIN